MEWVQKAEIFNKHSATISRALKNKDEQRFLKEKERRKLETFERTKEKKREWAKRNRLLKQEEYWYK